MAYFRAGDVRRAEQTMQEALKMDSTIPEAITAWTLIESGKTSN
jgi:Tfp pilus assembly protein PilF